MPRATLIASTAKAFAAFGRELEMLTQDALRFYQSHSVYGHFGGVVVDEEEGNRIADALWGQQGC